MCSPAQKAGCHCCKFVLNFIPWSKSHRKRWHLLRGLGALSHLLIEPGGIWETESKLPPQHRGGMGRSTVDSRLLNLWGTDWVLISILAKKKKKKTGANTTYPCCMETSSPLCSQSLQLLYSLQNPNQMPPSGTFFPTARL